MKVLITGVGITGKSSFRRILLSLLRDYGVQAEHYDTDEFQELRDKRDIDCKKPTDYEKDTVYIIEDIHGTIRDECFIPVKDYHFIIYLLPGILSHIMFWFPRMWKWFQCGKYSWEKTGWKGTEKPWDLRNIFPILRAFLRDMRNRKKWIKEDLLVVKFFPHIIIRSIWTRKGPRFRLEI